RVAERVVYRHRARPYAVLTGFWETLRTQELDRLGPLLAEAVRTGLGVEWAGAWLYAEPGRTATLRPLGVAGVDARRPLTIDGRAAERLLGSPCLVLPGAPPEPLPSLWAGPPAAVVPLVAADELVGLLACGERRADPLGPRDFELLELLARDCALRLRNLRLEAELRSRLEQIEAQAEALLHSRRRLVTAQDEERRRIERNLHDGIQQQLVALAVRLHRAAAEGDPLLADLASEAEQSVFALQDLARGIFPGVLVDQGLAAALRTQAGRMPLAVHVQVDTELVRIRLEPELETALYFVALEALTNVQKHAPQASAAVSLRFGAGEVVLEVIDDGPGFERCAGEGAGLQNMEDRIAAVGGMFSVEATPGGGTRVRAAVRAHESGRARLTQVDENSRDAPVELRLGRQA
ncbi:MAG TPA: ATP-binding protein, partial [Thermoleophilaceae bacterium]|nr:ATP-binding protein [Thermoleophilaceae bacterium]